MKSLLLLLLLLLYPLTSFAETDERKIDVYFANGISTDEGNATANTILLKRAIKKNTYKSNLKEYSKQIGKVAKSYNSTHGSLFDLTESLDQKLELIKLRDKIAALFGYITSHREDLEEQIKAYNALSPCVASPMTAVVKEETPSIC